MAMPEPSSSATGSSRLIASRYMNLPGKAAPGSAIHVFNLPSDVVSVRVSNQLRLFDRAIRHRFLQIVPGSNSR